MQPREPHTLKRCNRPITRQRIDRSDADSTALCGFELEVQLDIGEDRIGILYSKMSEAMKKDLQEAFEKAIAGFEKRQEAEHQRFREREKFENLVGTNKNSRCGSGTRGD
jgi:hypothetical protein